MTQQRPQEFRFSHWLRANWRGRGGWFLGWFVVGCAMISLLYQLPAQHYVDVGGNDGGYVQGFGPAQRIAESVERDPTTATSTARPLGPGAALLFPQLGSPSRFQITLGLDEKANTPTTPVRIEIVHNGDTLLGTVDLSFGWQTRDFVLPPAWTKPDDLFVLVRPVAGSNQDASVIWVADASLTTDWPLLPAPGQVLQGGLVLGLAAALLRSRRRMIWAALAGGVLWLLLYRMQLFAYPLRHWLRWNIIALTAALLIQQAPRVRALVRGWRVSLVLAGLIGLWLIQVWPSAQQHRVLAVPGVEKDFRVFATRSDAFWCPPDAVRAEAPCVWRADGFYQLGYPLLLWLVRPLVADNPFLAAQAVNLASAVVLLGATYLLGQRLSGRLGGLLAVMITAWSGFAVQSTLLLGTDLAFAAAWTVALAALAWLTPGASRGHLAATGALLGLAFALRHPGIVLLPFGWLMVWLLAGRPRTSLALRGLLAPVGWLAIGWLVVMLPQLIINVVDTGEPLYSQQAKNIWLAVFGNTDWRRWDEVSNSIGLSDVIRIDPGRFFANWGRNLVAFFGSGAGDLSEFGQANMLRLLAFPANLLAVFGLARWVWRGPVRARILAATALVYVVAISVSFVLPRFSLPLIGLWAVAASSQILHLIARTTAAPLTKLRWQAAAGAALALMLAGQPNIGTEAVLSLQAPAEIALVQALTTHVPPSATIRPVLAPDEFLAKYSAVAHRFSRNASSFTLWSSRSNTPRPTGTLVFAADTYELWNTED